MLDLLENVNVDELAGILADSWLKQYTADEISSAFATAESYDQYQQDPVGFGECVLGESYTPDVRRMMESVRDNVVTIAKSGNATGKTHAAARVAFWFYKCHPGAQVYTAAAPPEENLKTLLWGEIGSLIHQHERIISGDTVSMLSIRKSAKEFIKGVAVPASGTSSEREAKFSGKHAPYLLFIIDEGDAVPDEVYKGIESCMSGGHVRLLIMFNPRAPKGTPFRMERDGMANVVTMTAFDHPNVITGQDVIPGAVTREVTVRRINDWCRPLAAGESYSEVSCFKIPEFLVGCKAQKLGSKELYPPLKPGNYIITVPAFSYMVLARYPAEAEGQLISMEWISAARSRYDLYVSEHGEVAPFGSAGIMGLDVAEDGADENALCRRYGGLVLPIETWTGVDVVVSGERAASAQVAAGNITSLNIDATGVGSGSVPAANRIPGASAYAIKVAESPTKTSEMGRFGILKDQLWWSVREWLRTDPSAMLPPDQDLIDDLRIMTYSTDSGQVKVMKKKDAKKLLGRSTNKGDALGATFAETGFFGGLL